MQTSNSFVHHLAYDLHCETRGRERPSAEKSAERLKISPNRNATSPALVNTGARQNYKGMCLRAATQELRCSVGNLFWAGEATDSAWYATTVGAYESGIQAGRDVVRLLED